MQKDSKYIAFVAFGEVVFFTLISVLNIKKLKFLLFYILVLSYTPLGFWIFQRDYRETFMSPIL
jgi:hypothetical protein